MVFYGKEVKKQYCMKPDYDLVQTLSIIDKYIDADMKEVNMAVTLEYSKYQIS
jgi:hypothetical protein